MYGKPEYDPILEGFLCEMCYEEGDPAYSANLSYHVWHKHGITIKEYKEQFGIDKNFKLTSEDYRYRMREFAKESGVIENLKKRIPFSKGNRLGSFKRSFMSLVRLRQISRRKRKKHENKKTIKSSGN
jgi:hypothetical protein